MTQANIRNYIETQKDNARSTDEQIAIAHAMWDNGVGPQHDGLKRAEIEDELNLDLSHKPKTSLKHLVDIDVVEEFTRPGPDTYVIADWRDEDAFILGEVTEAAETAIESLIDHMQDDDPVSGGTDPAVADGGVTVRSVLSTRFDYEPQSVEEQLRIGDPVDKLNEAVDAIQETEDLETRDDYGEVVFINKAYRYRLSTTAVRLYEQEDD